VSSITYYTQDSARSELGTSLLQRLHGGFRPGDDRRGTALWQVAEIEHHGGQASPRGIREVFAQAGMRRVHKVHAIQHRLALQPLPGALQRLGLNVKGDDATRRSHRVRKKAGVTPPPCGRVNRPATRRQPPSHRALGQPKEIHSPASHHPSANRRRASVRPIR